MQQNNVQVQAQQGHVLLFTFHLQCLKYRQNKVENIIEHLKVQQTKLFPHHHHTITQKQ